VTDSYVVVGLAAQDALGRHGADDMVRCDVHRVFLVFHLEELEQTFHLPGVTLCEVILAVLYPARAGVDEENQELADPRSFFGPHKALFAQCEVL